MTAPEKCAEWLPNKDPGLPGSQGWRAAGMAFRSSLSHPPRMTPIHGATPVVDGNLQEAPPAGIACCLTEIGAVSDPPPCRPSVRSGADASAAPCGSGSTAAVPTPLSNLLHYSGAPLTRAGEGGRPARDAGGCAPRRWGGDQRRAVRVLRATSVDQRSAGLADRLATRPPADPFAPVDIAVPRAARSSSRGSRSHGCMPGTTAGSPSRRSHRSSSTSSTGG
jgi:hypothetical protein